MGFVYMVAKIKIVKIYKSKFSIFWKFIDMYPKETT